MLVVYGLNAWCVVHETSNACTIFTTWLFSIDYDAWRGLVDSTWGCNVDGVVAILLVLTIVTLREVCNMPIWCRSLSSFSWLCNNKYSCTLGVVIGSFQAL